LFKLFLKLANETLSADHRIIEGAYLALFNKKWKEYVEKPSKMIFTMK